MAEGEGRPVLTGLAALVGVAVVVGLVLGGGALAATQVLGLGEDSGSSESTSAESLYLPTPSKTPDSNDPAFTLAPGRETTAAESPAASETPADEIVLTLGQPQVGAMQNVDLTGVYPGGEGAILQVERLAGEEWVEFPVTASVSDETFSTYVQTGQLGENQFRMKDTDSGKVSNAVTVTIG
ncbi:hypothetical protein [Nocardioides sp. W7]|uniref:hypothetical protein n=1 Tax=Nocardioides sp. W7 TaxID=2931390 RepID=UPI001FD2C3C6|nr:hypothetical protein [Nocardioides sp. W7]